MAKRFSYSKHQKLKSKKIIDALFKEGRSVTCFPLKLVYLPTAFEDETIIKAGVSVSKRHFKNAVARNLVKRLLRESYRLNKNQYFNNSSTQFALMILYIGTTKPTKNTIDEAMKCALKKLEKKILDS